MTFNKLLKNTDEVNIVVATEVNQFSNDDIKEFQRLQEEISKLHQDTINLNKQIIEAKNHQNKQEQIRLLQIKTCIINERKIKEETFNKLLITDDFFNQEIEIINYFGEIIVTNFDVNVSTNGTVSGFNYIQKLKRRVSDFTSILDLVPVSGFVDYSLKHKQINNLVPKLGAGLLLGSVVTLAANPAQAGSLTTINFDEVNVDLIDENNPNRNDNNSIHDYWESYGLRMNSMKKNNYKRESNNKLWLYDSNCNPNEDCTGGDEDLATGTGEYFHKGKKITYNTEAQGNVLIIQERNGNNYAPDDLAGGGIMKFEFTNPNGVLFDSIGLLDFDESVDKTPEFMVKFADDNSLSKFFKFIEDDADVTNQTGEGNTEILTRDDSEYITEMTRQRGTKNGKVTDENSLREYKFDFGDRRITEFYVKLKGSGAVTDLNYYRGNKDLTRKVPEPTSILGLAAISGLAASSLKRKRKSSNIEFN